MLKKLRKEAELSRFYELFFADVGFNVSVTPGELSSFALTRRSKLFSFLYSVSSFMTRMWSKSQIYPQSNIARSFSSSTPC